MKVINIDDDQLHYINFLLIGDSFQISQKLRNKASDWGMDVLYDSCNNIAKAFCIYDQCEENWNYMSEYESLENFLREYEPILECYLNGEDIDLPKLVRSKYEQQGD